MNDRKVNRGIPLFQRRKVPHILDETGKMDIRKEHSKLEFLHESYIPNIKCNR